MDFQLARIIVTKGLEDQVFDMWENSSSEVNTLYKYNFKTAAFISKDPISKGYSKLKLSKRLFEYQRTGKKNGKAQCH